MHKRIEESFGWIKTVGGLRKTRFRGRDKVGWSFALTAAAYNQTTRPPAKAARSSGVSVLGRWRMVELFGYGDDYSDMVEPVYILFENGCGELAFVGVTGAFTAAPVAGGSHRNRV